VYLALGIPVVTTPIPQIDEYGQLLSVAKTPDAFVQSIRNAVKEDNQDLRRIRRQAVENDSWRHKADEVLQLVDKLAHASALSNL